MEGYYGGTDEDGDPIIAVKGNVTRKTNSGKSKHYKPMDFRILVDSRRLKP